MRGLRPLSILSPNGASIVAKIGVSSSTIFSAFGDGKVDGHCVGG
ncbi:hypothetical protein AB4472_09210 [Vibrio lentus]